MASSKMKKKLKNSGLCGSGLKDNLKMKRIAFYTKTQRIANKKGERE